MDPAPRCICGHCPPDAPFCLGGRLAVALLAVLGVALTVLAFLAGLWATARLMT